MRVTTLAGVWKDLYKRLTKAYDFGAMIRVKAGRPMVNLLLRAISPLGRRLTNMTVISVVRFCLACSRLAKSGGLRFLVIYLKACSTMLQQALGNQKVVDQAPFGARVSATNRGLPRVIPQRHRVLIRMGCVKTIRLWATLFGLYRVISIPGKVSLNTITSGCGARFSLLAEYSAFIKIFCKVLKKDFEQEGSITDALWPEEGEGPLEFMRKLRAVPFLISKVGPAAGAGEDRTSPSSTNPASILASAFVWSRHPLYTSFKDWCKMTGNTWVINRIESWTSKKMDPLQGSFATSLDSSKFDGKISEPWQGFECLGRLGFKTEPAGKIRVFAMVDCWTQWLMKPLHDKIFAVLRRIPQDGTFDQLGPIERLMAAHPGRLFSFDLSAATDRIPLVVQKILLSPFLTAWGAELWSQLMVARSYHHGPLRKKEYGVDLPAGEVYYGTGQPMGALSSWAMLALTHHSLVQFAAYRVGYPARWFPLYAVLGDDVVIGDLSVANSYREIMSDFDVKIGIHKSLISLGGDALEFAKRTFYKGVDVSMLPIAEFVAAVGNLAALGEYVRKYALSLTQALSALGYGYKVKGRLGARLDSLSPRVRLYLVYLFSPGAPFYKGIRPWLAMKSLSSLWKTAEGSLPGLLEHILESERKLLLERLNEMQPYLDMAKRLGTVYRDREFYGTVKRSLKIRPAALTGDMSAFAMALQIIVRIVAMKGMLPYTLPGEIRITTHPGISTDFNQSDLDLLNEMVYRNAYLDVAIEARDIRETIECLTTSSFDWEGCIRLWGHLDAIEVRLGELPLPRNIYTRRRGEIRVTRDKNVRRWVAYAAKLRRERYKSTATGGQAM